MCAGSASSPKTSLWELSTDVGVKSEITPPSLSQCTAYVTEATLRGTKTCKCSCNRASARTDNIIINRSNHKQADHNNMGTTYKLH